MLLKEHSENKIKMRRKEKEGNRRLVRKSKNIIAESFFRNFKNKNSKEGWKDKVEESSQKVEQKDKVRRHRREGIFEN